MNPRIKDRLIDLLRPKVGTVVEFDLNSQEFISFPMRAILWAEKKFEIEKGPPVKIDRRVIMGYTREPKAPLPIESVFHAIPNVAKEEPVHEEFVDFILSVGTKGICKDKLTDNKWVDLFLIRRPILGAFALGFVLACAGFMVLVDAISNKLLGRKLFNI